MNLQLLRRPGPGFPKRVASGIDDVDAYLHDVDACLLGSAKVRVLHLEEVKDHILERRDHALDRGRGADEATREALDMFGFAAEYGAEQRAGLSRRFWQAALSAGVLFAALMLVLDVIGRPPGTDAALPVARLTVQGALYGLAMGWFVAFVWPVKALPVGDRFAPAFLVRRSLPWRAACLVFAAGFTLLGVCCLVALFVPQAVAYFEVSQLGIAALGVLAVVNIRFLLLGVQTIAVDRDGFQIRMPWSKRTVPWSRVEAVERFGDRHPWIPGWNIWSRVQVIRYTTADGTAHESKIFPDVPNADRLTVLARDKIASRA
ncbi:MAG: hypothetical protein AAF721_07170 [Myxococcota bacterium]